MSVIVPVYNAEEYIEKCVSSLLGQTYRNLEIILVDDGSKDRSGEICDELEVRDSRISVLHTANGGVSAARNRGIDVATGQYLSFVDSDDWMPLDAYERLVSSALRDHCDLVYCDYSEVYSGRNMEHVSFPIGTDKEDTVRNMLLAGPRGGNPWNFILVSRELVEDEKIRFPEQLQLGEDFCFAFQCYISSRSIIHAEVAYQYNCTHLSSLSHVSPRLSDISIMRPIDECIDYAKKKGCYSLYEKEIGWRILLAKTNWMLNPRYFRLFREVHPEVNGLVDSCPFLGRGMKLVMKLVDRRLYVFASVLCLINRMKNG